MKRPKEEQKPWSTRVPSYFRLSGKEKITFFKYLGVMTEAGVPLEKSLIAIHNQSRSLVMHRALHIMLNDVASGEFLSTSLRKMPHIFDNLLVNLVEVGENSGTLTDSLLRISDYLEKARELKQKVRAALLYPLIVISGTFLITLYLLFVLLPQITPLFVSLNVELPWTTRFILALSNFLLSYGVFVLGGMLVFGIGFVFLLRIPSFRYAVDLVLLKLPIVGSLVAKTQITQFSRIIATLLTSGIVIVDAFKIASESVSNRVYRRSLTTIASSIQEGSSVSSYLEHESALFPPFVTQMVSVGEETGKLDESFLYIAGFSEKEVDDATKNLTTVLEPFLMILVGILVGFIAISIITPIYQLTQGIQTSR